MGKKSRKHQRGFDTDPYDDFDIEYENFMAEFDESQDATNLSKDIYSTDWGNDFEHHENVSARRKIERRNDRKTLHSQISDWDDWGEFDDWRKR
jgi:hypothetical protein